MTPAESAIVQAGFPEANGPMAFLNGAARAVGTALGFCPAGRGAQAAKGMTVLGHYPAYKQLADNIGARRFNIPESVWNTMSDAERWAANQKFLDRMISRGDDIILATPLENVRPGSYYASELEYLASKGYAPSADGTKLIRQ
ncbi:hypothetical protein HC024_21005 [Methylococcaceae bacterium WWC4]|nr:hypothetical protein [Methylococcaceae bacterium WWC4]